VRERSTCGLFAFVQNVWSPNGPQGEAPPTALPSLILAVDLVAVLESSHRWCGRRALLSRYEAVFCRWVALFPISRAG
jgi:hypothetical protein